MGCCVGGANSIYSSLHVVPTYCLIKKAMCIVLLKSTQEEERWNDGYMISCKNPVLVFEFDNGVRKTLRVPHKVYKSVQCGEAGTLFYKEEKKYTFFIDFIYD